MLSYAVKAKSLSVECGEVFWIYVQSSLVLFQCFFDPMQVVQTVAHLDPNILVFGSQLLCLLILLKRQLVLAKGQ